ncbi:MAG: histidinol dehydrogenase [Solirubrobacteraceae bacterium]
MRIERLDLAAVARHGGPRGAAARVRSLVPDGASVEGAVREILARVRAEGDEAVRDYTRRFDTAGNEPRPLTVSPEELDGAIKELPLELVAGLQVTIANVAAVAQAGVDRERTVRLPQGHSVKLRELPVGAAAVYVPGGRAPYPSTVVMGVVTARAAGVLDVVVCSPPGANGEIDRTILGACRLCGVQRVYRIGGAQAIAALAHGTETVGRVDVVVGPGNLFVQEAKRQLSGVVGIDGFAGPSDLVAVLGEQAGPPVVELAALDMLAQAEHGAGSLVVAIAASARTLDELAAALERLIVGRPTVGEAVCALLEVADGREAVELANELAPEHLELIGADVEALAPRVCCAGALFVGEGAATAFGDYVAGSNHVLPTGGAARFASGLSPRHFRRRMQEVRIGPDAVGKLAAAGAPIAHAEGFEVHAESMRARIGENEGR